MRWSEAVASSFWYHLCVWLRASQGKKNKKHADDFVFSWILMYGWAEWLKWSFSYLHIWFNQDKLQLETFWVLDKGREIWNIAIPLSNINYVCGSTLLFVGQKTVLLHSYFPFSFFFFNISHSSNLDNKCYCFTRKLFFFFYLPVMMQRDVQLWLVSPFKNFLKNKIPEPSADCSSRKTCMRWQTSVFLQWNFSFSGSFR